MVDEERAAALREEARTLFQLRNMAVERLEAGDERAEPLLVAVMELIAERELESEEALWFEDEGDERSAGQESGKPTDLRGSDGRFVRIAAMCGLVVPITSTIGWAVGGLVQPEGFSSTDDDISDLGAMTASAPWIYNQIGANLTGFLLVLFAAGLWRALSPDIVGRIGAGAVFIVGLGVFLDGFFRLDCQGIDANCVNDSWHSDAHKMEGRFTVTATILAPIILAFAFRRLPHWRNIWIPTLAAIPVSLLAGILFSAFGTGASTRATSLTWTLWAAFVAFQLLQKSERTELAAEPA